MSLLISQHLRRGDFRLDADLELPLPGISAIFGPSGSGKSTLLRAVAGLDRHPGGRVRIGARTWQDGDTFVPVHRRNIGYVFQEDNLFPHLSAAGNIAYGASRAGNSAREVDEIVQLLDIDELLARKPQALSGGERQKVAIARALAMKPELLLMDEPFAGLDLRFRDAFLPRLRSLLHELALPALYVSHAPDEVAQLADTLVLLQRNAPACHGELGELLTGARYGLATRRDAESVIEARVRSHDAGYGLLDLEFSGGELQITGPALPAGRAVRVRILAQDVSLTLQRQQSTSILNIVPATVLELLPGGDGQLTVLLALGDDRLLARLTRKSADQLALEAGKPVFAQIKSVAVLN